MTTFVVTITDPAQLAGITWAREQFNAALPPPPPPPPEGMSADEAALLPPVVDQQRRLETDADYVQWVMEQAAASYATQQEDAAWRAERTNRN